MREEFEMSRRSDRLTALPVLHLARAQRKYVRQRMRRREIRTDSTRRRRRRVRASFYDSWFHDSFAFHDEQIAQTGELIGSLGANYEATCARPSSTKNTVLSGSKLTVGDESIYLEV